MKDYIDKLREDYHRKKVQKLAFGDKFKAKINDWRYGKISTPEQEVDENGNPIVKAENKPKLTNSQMGLGTSANNDMSYAPGYTPMTTGPNPFAKPSDFSSSFNTGPKLDKDGKPIQLTNSQMGLGDDKDVIYAPGYEPPVNPFKQEITSTYDGKEPPSFMKETLKKEEEAKKAEEAKKLEEEAKKQKGFFLPPQGDLTTNLYNLGRAIGAKPGTKGRGLSIAGNAGAAALEGARALFSGVGFSKAQGYTDQYNQQQMIDARKKYESNPQYKNTNYMGGPTQTRAGGTIRVYEDGGEQQMDPRMQQMMAQQQGQVDPRMQQEMDPRMAEQQQQMDPRMQQQQETQMNQQEAQAYQQIAEKLVSSFETIEEIADYLNENGVDEVAFNAIIKFAQDMMEDKEESADDNEEATEEPEEGEGEGEMRKGGKKFNKKVGEYIEFEYGGKTYKGTIKSIKNGQIFLK